MTEPIYKALFTGLVLGMLFATITFMVGYYADVIK